MSRKVYVCIWKTMLTDASAWNVPGEDAMPSRVAKDFLKTRMDDCYLGE
jgi:hypothetical protein